MTVASEMPQVATMKSIDSGGYVGREEEYMLAKPEKRSVEFIGFSLLEADWLISYQILSRFYPDGKPELLAFSGCGSGFVGETGWQGHLLSSIVLLRTSTYRFVKLATLIEKLNIHHLDSAAAEAQ
jgi:hypothetical protein